jgi:polyisoprenoid-binding protein YceI
LDEGKIDQEMISRITNALGLGNKEKYTATIVKKDACQYNFTAINMRFNKVKGFFKYAEIEASFNIHELDSSFLNISWPIEGIRSGIAERDKQLIEAPHFFNGLEYPNISFKSTEIVRESKQQLVITGSLFIKEHRREVSLYMGYSQDKNGYQLFIDYNVDRFEFGIGESGSFAIGRQIELELDIHLLYEKP